MRFVLAALALTVASSATQAADAHPIIAGFERFYTGEKPDLVAGGRLLLGELNCTSCHAAEDVAAKKQAPNLDGIMGRVRASYLKKYLSDPHAVKPGGTMPSLFAGDPEKDAKVEALVQFLSVTGALKQEKPDVKAAIIGRDLYTKIGCVACHGPRDGNGLPEKNLPAYIVPLGDLKAKYSITGLSEFLDNPLHVRPSGRMPHLLGTPSTGKKDGKDSRDLANYLLQGVKVSIPQGIGSTSYSYFEGSWKTLPDFSKMKAKATGTGPAFDLGSAKRGTEYGLRFEGYVKMKAAGEYTFTLSSDDGSRLFIDGKKVIDNDGVHALKSVSATPTLRKDDAHHIVVEFFNAAAGADLTVEIEGRGLARQPLGAHIAATVAQLDAKPEEKKAESEDGFELKPDLIAKGRLLFSNVGCANCHQLTIDKKPIVPILKAMPLASLKVTGGCLAEPPAKGTPDYDLNERQRAALAAFIPSSVDKQIDSAAVIGRTMTMLNCYACHARDKIGGPTEEMNKFFLTVQPEMGDEGRVPPTLDGVGAKLNVAYFKNILDKGAHDRPYMHTRMPGFGAANIAHLQPLFASLDKVPVVDEVSFEAPDAKVKAAARHLVGDQALSCIKCHTFNGVKAEGIQGIDMTVMPKRINRDWFHFYMLDPQKYRPGTRMPSAFVNGMSPLPMLLDGKAATQIESIWVYLKQGGSAALPLGMGKKSIPLKPITEAIIYRNFIQGAGARAIGVGYPEKMSIAFDANDMRLALIWQGAFIDAAKHWEGRGPGFEGPLGDNVLSFPAGAEFAVLATPATEWPKTPPKEQGFKFIGYRLTPDERPTFDYSLNGVKIEDFPNPSKVGKDPSLKRTFTLTSTGSSDALYFRAAVGTKIEALDGGWYKIDGWKMKLDAAGTAKIRESGKKSELLLPVTFKDGKATIVQEFVW